MTVREEHFGKNYPALLNHPVERTPEKDPPLEKQSASEPQGEIFIGVFLLAALVLALSSWFLY